MNGDTRRLLTLSLIAPVSKCENLENNLVAVLAKKTKIDCTYSIHPNSFNVWHGKLTVALL